MDIECHPYGIFEGIEHAQKVEAIFSFSFEASVGFGDIIKKVVS